MKYKIEKGITCPSPYASMKPVYPFSEMKKGDMFRAPFLEQGKIRLSVSYYNRKHAGKIKYTVRVLSKTEVGVWRIK